MAKNACLKMSPIGVQPFQTKYFTGLLVVETRIRILFIAVEISLDCRILCTALGCSSQHQAVLLAKHLVLPPGTQGS